MFERLTLSEHYSGYGDYAEKVAYRFVPVFWQWPRPTIHPPCCPMAGEQLLLTDLSNFGSPAQKTQSLPRLCAVILLAVFEFESVICDHAQSFVEVALHLSPVQQAFFFDPFYVGKVAERSEPKNLQEFLRLYHRRRG